MLERSDYPGLARVIRVQSRADEVPAPGFSWQDYQDVDNGNDTLNEGEGEWDVVKSKARLSSSNLSLFLLLFTMKLTSTPKRCHILAASYAKSPRAANPETTAKCEKKSDVESC